jgi:hypothetical protein
LKRVKNKHELTPTSGVSKKVEYRNVILFGFKFDNKVFKNGNGRLKITEQGHIQYLIKKDDKWQTVKGELLRRRSLLDLPKWRMLQRRRNRF